MQLKKVHLVEAQTQEKALSTFIIRNMSKYSCMYFSSSQSLPDALNIDIKYSISKVLHHIQHSHFAQLLFLHTVYWESVSDFRCHPKFKERSLDFSSDAGVIIQNSTHSVVPPLLFTGDVSL